MFVGERSGCCWVLLVSILVVVGCSWWVFQLLVCLFCCFLAYCWYFRNLPEHLKRHSNSTIVCVRGGGPTMWYKCFNSIELLPLPEPK